MGNRIDYVALPGPLKVIHETVNPSRFQIPNSTFPVSCVYIGERVSRYPKSLDKDLDRANCLILYSYGNQEVSYNIDRVHTKLVSIAKALNVVFVVYDYPKYGKYMKNVAIERSEQNLYHSIESVYDHLLEKHPNKNILLWGRSIGTTAVCHLAKRQYEHGMPVAGMILESPPTSALSMFCPSLMSFFTHFPGDEFCNLEKAKGCNWNADTKLFEPNWGLTLVIHGRNDTVIPSYEGEKLAEACATSAFVIEDCGHDDIPVDQIINYVKTQWFQSL